MDEILNLSINEMPQTEFDCCLLYTSAFQYIEKMFSLNPEETWYIGDTYEADVVGADGAGWHTVWFNHRNRERLENCADVTVKSIEELSRFIKERS